MQLIQRLLSNQFIRRVALLAGGTAAGQLLVALSSPVITRLYTPDHLGMLSVFTAILTPCLALVSLRYEVAIVLPNSERDAIGLLWLSLGLVAVTASLSALPIWLIGQQISDALGSSGLSPYLWLLPLSLLSGGAFQALSYWGIRQKSYGLIGQSRLFQSVAAVAIQIAGGLLGLAPLGLLAGDALSRATGSFRLARKVSGKHRQTGPPTRELIGKVALRYKKFPLYSAGPAIINSVNLNLPTLLISSLYGTGPVGLFALGQRLLGAPLGLVSNAVGQVFLGDAALEFHENPNRLRTRFSRTWKTLLLIGSSVVLPLSLIAPWAFDIIFGNDWKIAGVYLQLLSPMFIAQFVSGPLGSVLDVLERQDLHVLRELVRFSLVVVAVAVARSIEDEPEVLIACLSVAGSLGYIFGLTLVSYSIRSALRQAKDHR